MFGSVQRIAGFPAELGVQRQYLDGELHLVDNALSGAVAAAEQFEIRDVVVESVPVNVMDRFLFVKFAAYLLLHHVAMFKNFVEGFSVRGRYTQQRVFSSNAPCDSWKTVLSAVAFTDPLVFALSAAKKLSVVDRAAAFSARAIKSFAAVFAASFVAFIRIFSPAEGRAGDRAIQRVFAESFLISRQVRGLHRKRFGTFPAFKINSRDLRSSSTVRGFVRKFTGGATVLAGSFSLSSDSKRLPAILAGFFHDHRGSFCLLGRRQFVTRMVA